MAGSCGASRIFVAYFELSHWLDKVIGTGDGSR
jgi:hypothetical protein